MATKMVLQLVQAISLYQPYAEIGVNVAPRRHIWVEDYQLYLVTTGIISNHKTIVYTTFISFGKPSKGMQRRLTNIIRDYKYCPCKRCDFADADFEIMLQIILFDTSIRLRK